MITKVRYTQVSRVGPTGTYEEQRGVEDGNQRTRTHTHTHTNTNTHTHWTGESTASPPTGRTSKPIKEKARVSVCVCVTEQKHGEG